MAKKAPGRQRKMEDMYRAASNRAKNGKRKKGRSKPKILDGLGSSACRYDHEFEFQLNNPTIKYRVLFNNIEKTFRIIFAEKPSVEFQQLLRRFGFHIHRRNRVTWETNGAEELAQRQLGRFLKHMLNTRRTLYSIHDAQPDDIYVPGEAASDAMMVL